MRKITAVYSFPSRLGTTGVGATAWHQVSGLLQEGIDVQLYCGSCEKPIDDLSYLRETLVPWGVKLPIRLLGTERAAALHDRIVANAIKQTNSKSNIDVIHCWPLGAEETLRTARKLGIKTLVERPNCHTRYAYEVVKQEHKKLGVKLYKSHSHSYNAKRLHREENEYALADLLLCPSEFVARTFQDQGFSKGKIARHQYGFDTSKFTLDSTDSRLNDNNFKMAFVGSCEPRKGLHYAIDAWLASEASENGIFYICGNYTQGYRDFLAKKLAHPSVKEVGFLNDVSGLLQKCHALILPSIEEGSALVTYEARACGCVLLVSEASGAQCVHMHDSLVHRVGDVATLRKHINMLASDRSFYQMLQKNSLAELDQLTWARAAEVLVDIYGHAINQSSA